MKQLKIFCSGKHIIETAFNGTCAEAIAYYIGKALNVGIEDDKMVYGNAIEIDGISYNPSTHRYISDRAHEKNKALIASRIAAREAIESPRIGDFLYVWSAGEKAGEYMRLTHEWPNSIQTTCARYGDATEHGGFYSCKQGGTSYSGSLDSGIEKENIIPTDETRLGRFWCFNGDSASANNGISFYMPCRVYRVNPLDMPRTHKIRLHFFGGHTIEKECHGTSAQIAREAVGAVQWRDSEWRLCERVQFFDGEIWQTHKNQCKALYFTHTVGHVLDWGSEKGLEAYSVSEDGYKWYLDGRREQLLEQGQKAHFWSNFIKKEFSQS